MERIFQRIRRDYVREARDWISSIFFGADISIFHQFFRPPYGGGNQFLLALRGEWNRRGFRVETNRISKGSRVCLFNSYNFDVHRLRSLRRSHCRMLHRVDGPIGLYRGKDEGIDQRILDLNSDLADVTVFQSHFSLTAHEKLGLRFSHPVVIPNAVDSKIFFPSLSVPTFRGRKIRLISTSWSTNLNKGFETYSWLDRHLDWSRFEYTFLGRSEISFKHINIIPPAPSAAVAQYLREHDIYITASINDPCSNALLEALACGLPCIFLRSGGHPEIVGTAGYGFFEKEEIPALVEQLFQEYESTRSMINIPSIEEVGDRYVELMGIGE